MTTVVMTCLLLIEMHTYVFLVATILMKNCPIRTTINVSWLRILIYVRFPLILQQLPEHSQEENHKKGETRGLLGPTTVPASGVGTTDPGQTGLTHGK